MRSRVLSENGGMEGKVVLIPTRPSLATPLFQSLHRQYSKIQEGVLHVGSGKRGVGLLTALVLGSGGGHVMIPRLTDVLSDRSISLLSGGILITGALVAAVIDNYPALVVGSVLLGFGSAAQLVPLSFLRRHLDGNAVATAVTVLIMATGSGVVLGMLGGGLSM
jgi:MFS family permease